jgi:penicillin-binding protein 1A
MKSQIERLKRSFSAVYHRAKRQLVILTNALLGRTRKLVQYLNGHPRTKWTVLIVGPVVTFLFLLLITVWIETPSNRKLRNIQNQVASEVYSADGVLLGRYYIEDRTEVAYEEISSHVLDALIATEDVRFYQHQGVDFVSLGRVFVKSILQQDESSGGGSTITQQLSKNLYPRKRYWILSMVINKMREAITASRLERFYNKKELLTLYLNTIPFADNTFGIEAAAHRFFSTTAGDVTIDEAAILIGSLKATTYYNPRLYPDRAFYRRNIVISQMLKYNYISQEAADSLMVKPIELNISNISHHYGLAPYFRQYLKGELLAWCKNNKRQDGSPYNLYTDGLKIYTTIDSRLQAYAEQAVTQQMTEVQHQFFAHWADQLPWTGKGDVVMDAVHRSSRYLNLKKRGNSEEQIMAVFNKPISMRLFTWQGPQDVTVSPMDSIIHHLQYLNAGLVALDPGSGQVKAWVGGIEHDFFQFDHVKASTKRQVGSTFKPIVYAMAIEEGNSPCELISAERQTYVDTAGVKWTPRNSQNDYKVTYTMRGALAYSVNTVAVKLIQQAGVDNTIALARKMGITSEIPEVPSIALGSSSISLMEMTTAYACLANEGVTHQPYYIDSIIDGEGKRFDEFKPVGEGKRALSVETSQLVTRLMQTVVHEGTASRLRWKYGIYNDVAGKTGTTQSNADGWFIGMTPRLVIGTWVGADDPRIRFRSTELGQGSSTALPMVAYFLKHVDEDTAFAKLSKARFKPLPYELQERLDCDLYELDDALWEQIRQTVQRRDSLILADTSATPPTESFLEYLYKRKLRIIQASEPDTTKVTEIKVIGG